MRWPGVTIEFPSVWVGDRGRWESPDGRYYFDQAAADRACDFFPAFLKHHIGEFAGQVFTLRDDQAMLLTRPIFGWKRASDGQRRIRKVFAFCAKGYGKSPWGAGTGIYAARCDGESAAEVYAVAADREQGRTVHDNAKIMVENDPDLYHGAEITKDAIVWAATHSVYKVLSSDAATKHGMRPYVVIFDEFHAQRNRDLYEALKKSMVKRRQPLMIIITHAGNDDEGICYEEYEYAKRVLSGTIPDDTCLPVIFESSDRDDWTDPAVWARVNPGHGITVQHDGIAGECLEAQNEPRKKNDFLRYHLNRWVSQATAWIPIEWWDACELEALNHEELQLLPCAAGLDMAQKIDLASFVMTFRRRLATPLEVTVITEASDQPIVQSLNFSLIVVPFFWIPENTMLEREREDNVPYSLWRDAGLVTATEGDVIDYDRMFRDITEKIAPRFPRLKGSEIGFDPAFATDMAQKLAGAGYTTVEILQGYKHFSEPCHLFEGLLKAKRVEHAVHRLMRWNVENVAIKKDEAGRIKPVKPRGGRKRIDGVVATLMGLKLLSTQPDEAAPGTGFSASPGLIVRPDGIYDADGNRLA